MLISPPANRSLGAWLELADADNPFFMSSENHPLELIPRWFGCLVSGLTYLHSQNLVHQSIEPENILIHGRNIIFTGISSTMSKSPPERTTRYCAHELFLGLEFDE